MMRKTTKELNDDVDGSGGGGDGLDDDANEGDLAWSVFLKLALKHNILPVTFLTHY